MLITVAVFDGCFFLYHFITNIIVIVVFCQMKNDTVTIADEEVEMNEEEVVMN